MFVDILRVIASPIRDWTTRTADFVTSEGDFRAYGWYGDDALERCAGVVCEVKMAYIRVTVIQAKRILARLLASPLQIESKNKLIRKTLPLTFGWLLTAIS